MRLMKTEHQWFTIDELKEKYPNAYQQAIEKYFACNVEHEWWQNEFLLDPQDPEVLEWKGTCRQMGLSQSDIDDAFTTDDVLIKCEIESFDFERNYHICFRDVYYSGAMRRVILCLFNVPAYLHQYVDISHTKIKGREPQSTFNLEINLHYDEEEVYQIISSNRNGSLKLAEAYLDELIEDTASNGIVFFQRALSSIQKQYEYLTSEEAIYESIESNGMEFELDNPNDASACLR